MTQPRNALLVLLLLLAATLHAREPINVVATTGYVGDVAARVGGPDIALTVLMGPGVDPHLYKATPADVRALQQAEVVFYNGLHLEGKMTDVLHRLARTKTVAAFEAAIPPERIRSADGAADPHVWFDASLWAETPLLVAETLAKRDPDRAAAFRERAEAYRAELLALHDWATAELAAVPAGRRVLVTAHDAFGYFGAAYGFEVHAPQGISTLSEYGLADVNGLVDFIVEKRLPAIFVESSVSPRSIDALRAGATARGHEVRLGGSLYSDALGPKEAGADTFPGAFRSNVRTIVEALR
ncbi:MAG: zinc ABC transporter substrate-binding protein [Candidatus Sumerlaeia bacterium]|nr:zinc ABC transporter substrate-binding protein [Candidatus Sumerlaeia bacterium]